MFLEALLLVAFVCGLGLGAFFDSAGTGTA